jgi:hypothetical protein
MGCQCFHVLVELVLLAAFMLGGCAGGHQPKYPEFEVTQHDEPKTTFRFSAGDATPEWPIMITAPGRELQADENSERMSLQRSWVAEHVQKDARLASMGDGKCGPSWIRPWLPPLPSKPIWPNCDIMSVDDPGRPKRVDFYFYVGNWPTFKDYVSPKDIR